MEETYVEDGQEEEDDLGYYADGVKRTLTDEQIAIFRHSEIQSILRQRRHAEEAKEMEDSRPSSRDCSVAEAEEGEVADEDPVTSTESGMLPTSSEVAPQKAARKSSKKQRKAQYAKDRGFFKYQIKPDLRKRTWDKVDAGMDSLAYDDESSSATQSNLATQRRRISYDD